MMADEYEDEMEETEEEAYVDAAWPSILLDAFALVHGNRGRLYNHPWKDYGMVTQLFNTSVGDDLLTPAEGVYFMLCVKMARLANGLQQGFPAELLQDTLTDIAGYADALWGVLLNPEPLEEEELDEEEYEDDDY
jgi:hypothetical protein